MPQAEIAGALCPIGSKAAGRKYDDMLKSGEIIQVINIEGKMYAGADAHSYPDCEKPLLDIGAFCIGLHWEWHDERNP